MINYRTIAPTTVQGGIGAPDETRKRRGQEPTDLSSERDAEQIRGARMSDWHRVLDTTIAVAALLSIVFLANGAPRPEGFSDFLAMRISLKNALLLGAFVAMWPLVLTASGVYEAGRTWSFRSEFFRLATACAVGSGIASFIPLFSESGNLGWAMLPALWIATTAGTMALRFGTRRAASMHKTRSVPRHVVIVGTGPRAAKLWADLRRDVHTRYELLAVSDVDDAQIDAAFGEQSCVRLDALETYFMHTAVDEVYVALPVRSKYEEIEQTLKVCERGGVHARFLADTFSPTIARPRHDPSSGRAIVDMHVVSHDWRLGAKRGIDIVGAAIGLALLSPLLLLTALAIRIESAGPVFFSQERYGFRKRRFRMWKFRTMVPNAEKLQAQLEEKNEAQGPVFKIKADPRVTRIGGFLRRTSLDELPQLWNVLRGDMALVGPRPLPIRDVSRFNDPGMMRRFSVRPGATGLWQVSGRSALSFEQWMALDLHYIDNWSLALDLKVLAKTIPAVLVGAGAQ